MNDFEKEKSRTAKNVNRTFAGCGISIILIIGLTTFGVTKMCSNNDNNYYNTNKVSNEEIKPNSYQIISTVFIGNPTQSEIQPMLETILRNYNKPINDDEIMKFANGLLVMRKDSKIGITEMQILKHMYQHFDSKIDMAGQLALSSSLLEMYK